jgi:hypothetical protein
VPLPIHIKWYETPENLDGLKALKCSRTDSSVPVVSTGMGGVLVNFERRLEKWHIEWNNVDGKITYHFNLSDTMGLTDPLNLMLPVVKFTDRWSRARGMNFDLSRLINNRVGQLLRFLGDKWLLVPNGTLFIVTRAGIKTSLADNRSWSLIIGYSAVEPEPKFQCKPMYSDTPELRIPKSFEVVQAPDPPRLSRYERPWVI